MRPEFIIPPKVVAGDRVAVVSPSFAAPAVAPAIHQQAMARLRKEFQLEPVEYPTTRQLGAAARERAADLVTAFADPTIKAVLATIGGDDQLTVLPFLDPAVVRANPKPFAGYSDNTNLLNWLWNQGIVGYHGGSTMVHLGRGRLHPVSTESLRSALFERGRRELREVPTFADEEIDWADPAALTDEPPSYASPGWQWHHPNRIVTGPSGGGNLEILHWNLAAGRWMRPVDDYAGCVLLIETSEEMPPAEEVFRMLRNAGERGLLAQFPAVLVATAKGTSRTEVRTIPERQDYRDAQKDAVLRAFAHYNNEAMIVFGVDFGHTDPQWVLPYGGQVTVDGPARRIFVDY